MRYTLGRHSVYSSYTPLHHVDFCFLAWRRRYQGFWFLEYRALGGDHHQPHRVVDTRSKHNLLRWAALDEPKRETPGLLVRQTVSFVWILVHYIVHRERALLGKRRELILATPVFVFCFSILAHRSTGFDDVALGVWILGLGKEKGFGQGFGDKGTDSTQLSGYDKVEV